MTRYCSAILICIIMFFSFDLNAGDPKGTYRICKATGSSAISMYCAPANQVRILSISVRFSAAPSTAGDFSIIFDSIQGSAYDVLLYKIDPSVASATSIVWNPCTLGLVYGDMIKITYANPNGLTYGILIYYETMS